MSRKNKIFLILTSIALFGSCIDKPIIAPDSFDPETKAKEYLRQEYMGVYYYWQKEVKNRNANMDLSKYDVYEAFDKLLYEKDRWSWMCDKDTYINSEVGIVTGTYGVSLSQAIDYYNDYSVKVRYVFPGSPFDDKGVTRGWTLTHINGVEVSILIKNDAFSSEFSKSPQNFTFKDTQGVNHTFTASSVSSLSTRSYLKKTIFGPNDVDGLLEKVGYFHYLAFKHNMIDDIERAMFEFKAAGIKKLILDLRYNGGGDFAASESLVSYLAPKSANGEVFVRREHNELLSKYDADHKIERNPDALDLDRIYIITGKGTASASEMLINGLKPLMDIQTVGEVTYGKPNGMYVLYYPGSEEDYEKYENGNFENLKYVFLPIAFYNSNKNNEHIPDDGIVPTNYRADDLYHDFDQNEDLIKACLNHISTGQYPSLPHRIQAVTPNGKKILLGEEETNPHYGACIIQN